MRNERLARLTPGISAVTGPCLKTKLQINPTPGNDHMHVVVCCCKGSHYLRSNQLRIQDALYLSSVVRVSAFLGGSKSSNWIESANHMFVTATTASIVWWFTFQSRLTCAFRSFTSRAVIHDSPKVSGECWLNPACSCTQRSVHIALRD